MTALPHAWIARVVFQAIGEYVCLAHYSIAYNDDVAMSISTCIMTSVDQVTAPHGPATARRHAKWPILKNKSGFRADSAQLSDLSR
ncbi:hypothetical protein ACFQAT_20455 [Undibacterium arcticum]|uniref:Uncharacterized protein n=1 Tax=Undibacterium arcticum TaxID=1762892 RepID=A0ABV7EZL6_9BURK